MVNSAVVSAYVPRFADSTHASCARQTRPPAAHHIRPAGSSELLPKPPSIDPNVIAAAQAAGAETAACGLPIAASGYSEQGFSHTTFDGIYCEDHERALDIDCADNVRMSPIRSQSVNAVAYVDKSDVECMGVVLVYRAQNQK
jgi:hypothetical protein